jgi:hypothetical protein
MAFEEWVTGDSTCTVTVTVHNLHRHGTDMSNVDRKREGPANPNLLREDLRFNLRQQGGPDLVADAICDLADGAGLTPRRPRKV